MTQEALDLIAEGIRTEKGIDPYGRWMFARHLQRVLQPRFPDLDYDRFSALAEGRPVPSECGGPPLS